MKPALHQLCQLAHLKLRVLGDRRAQDADPAGSCEIQYDIAVSPAHCLSSSQYGAMLVQLIKPYVQASEWLLVDHHHAHAAMGWLDSPFYRQKGYSSLILSYDGGGGDGNLRLFLGKSGDHNLKALGPGQAWHSYGNVYEMASSLVRDLAWGTPYGSKPPCPYGKKTSCQMALAGSFMAFAAIGNVREEWRPGAQLYLSRGADQGWWLETDFKSGQFFPRAFERRVLPTVGVCKTSSHLHISSSHLIFTSSHLHICSSSHPLIFTSSHLHICSSSHLPIFTSAHLHTFPSSRLLIFTSAHLHICSSSHLPIFTSSHLHICSSSHPLIFTSAHLHTFPSSHLLIFTPSHLHIFSSSHLLIFTSAHLHICSSSHLLIFTSSHLHICSSSHLLIFTSAHLHICSSSHLPIFTSSHLHICSSSHLLIFTSAHLHICSSSHLLIFTPAHLLSHAFFLSFSLKAEGGAGGESRNVNPFARNEGRSAKTEVKLRFDLPRSNPFARNEGRSAKTEVNLRFYLC